MLYAVLLCFLIFLQGVMVRLMLVLAPIMCILSGVAVSNILRTFLPNMYSESTSMEIGSSAGGNSNTISSGQKRTGKNISSDPTYPFKSQVS